MFQQEHFHVKQSMNSTSLKLNPWYITGLCEGEGSFTFSRSGRHIGLYFAVKLTKADEKLLYGIYEFFGVGKIYNVKPLIPGKFSGYTKASVYYRITKTSELESVIMHFDQYPLKGEKAKRYRIWKELFLLKKKNFKRIKWKKEEKDRCDELVRMLSSLSPRNTPWV